MPFATTAIRLYGLPVVDVASFAADVAEYNGANPESQIPVSTFLGKANSFRWTTGRTPGRGWILMRWEHLQNIDLKNPVTLEFEVEGQIVALTNLVILHAVKVCGHTDDPNAVYIVELTDHRHYARGSAIDKQFNVLTPDNFIYDAGNVVTTDWNGMAEAVWNEMPDLGAWPGLPVVFEEPPFFRFPCEDAYEALDVILKQLDCVLNFDAGQFAISEHGSGADATALQTTLDAWSLFMLDSQPKENINAKLAATVHVCFPSRNWFYGEFQSTPTTQTAWQTRPNHSIDVALGDGQGTEVLWDDLPALWDIDGTLINGPQLAARANARAAAYVQSRLIGGVRFKRTYSGLCNGEFRTSGALSGVAYHEFGDGIKTTILRTPREITDHEGDWTNPSILTVERESVAPPDIARANIPHEQFCWVKILAPIAKGECGPAVVLRATAEASSCGISWIPCRTPQGDLVITIHEVTGQASYEPGQRVCVRYHWQAYRWTIMGGASGGGSGWWSSLSERIGQAYSHFEVDRHTMGCDWTAVSGGIFGAFNAFDINCSSHNSQGPRNNLIVHMFGPFIDVLTGEPFYLFDYAGTNELDIERYPFSP